MVTNTHSSYMTGDDAIARAIELKESSDYKDRMVAITAFAFHFGEHISRTAEKHLNDLTSDPNPDVAELAVEALKRCNLMP